MDVIMEEVNKEMAINMKEADTQTKQMSEEIQKLEEVVQFHEKVAEDYIEQFNKFSDLYEGTTLDGKRAEEVLEFVCKFSDKLEEDNRQLLQRVNE